MKPEIGKWGEGAPGSSNAASGGRLGQPSPPVLAGGAKPTACDTCAFGPLGSGGAADEENGLTAQICAFGGIPFFCHHGRDGQEYDWKNDPLGPLALSPGNRKLCQGWRVQVGVLKRSGYFPDRDMTYIRRAVARRAQAWLMRWKRKDIGRTKKKQAWAEFKRCFKFIMARDIGDKGLPL